MNVTLEDTGDHNWKDDRFNFVINCWGQQSSLSIKPLQFSVEIDVIIALYINKI